MALFPLAHVSTTSSSSSIPKRCRANQQGRTHHLLGRLEFVQNEQNGSVVALVLLADLRIQVTMQMYQFKRHDVPYMVLISGQNCWGVCR